jgi:polyisoprenoid-binding protein YceI
VTDLNDGVMPPPAGSYAFDPVHTFAEFRVRHLIVGKVRGRFDSISGDFVISHDPANFFGHVEVRFFDVENFPAITFRGSGGTQAAANVWIVSGDLTIRHITRPIILDVTVRGANRDTRGKTKVGLTATAPATRADFELTTELLQESGDASGSDIEIEIRCRSSAPRLRWETR